MARSPPLKQRDALQLFPGRFGGDLDAAVERIVLVQQRQVRAPAAEQLGKHFAEIRSHLIKRFGKQFPGSEIDSRDHVEQLVSRIGEIGILPFEKFVTLFQLVVLVDSIQINRAHVIELRS